MHCIIYQSTNLPSITLVILAVKNIYVTACVSQPCQNNGSCDDLPMTQYQCTCMDGYNGVNCETASLDCASDQTEANSHTVSIEISFLFDCSYRKPNI